MAEPALSVIVPVRDGAGSIGAALESLARHGRVDEVVVVDDGSRDDSAEVARAAGARVIRQEARGVAAARNRGVAAARGEWIGFLDADDRWAELDGGDHRLAALAADASLPGALGRCQLLRCLPGRPAEPIGDPFHATSLAALVARRAVFDAVGRFAEELEQAEDLDWLLRARRLGLRFLEVPQVTLLYRRHGANTTADRARRTHHFLVALRREIERKRSGACG